MMQKLNSQNYEHTSKCERSVDIYQLPPCTAQASHIGCIDPILNIVCCLGPRFQLDFQISGQVFNLTGVRANETIWQGRYAEKRELMRRL